MAEASSPDSTARAPAVPALPPSDAARSRIDLATATGMALLLFILYITPAIWRPLSETAEARIAVVAREMLRSGDWIVPELGGRPRYEKPPLPYWLVAVAAKALGPDPAGRIVTEQAATLPSIAFAAFCVFLVAAWGARVHGRTAGVWAGLLLGLSMLFVNESFIGRGDVPLTFFTAAALLAAAWLACAPKPRAFCALALGLSLGLAALCKGHIPVLIVLAALAAEAIRRRAFNPRKAVLFVVALVVAAAVFLPWYLLLLNSAQDPGAQKVMFQEMLGGQGGSGHHQKDRLIFYVYQLVFGLLPWSLLLVAVLPVAIRRARLEKRTRQTPETLAEQLGRFMLWAAALGFVGMYLFPKQQEYYLLPILPPLAIWLGMMVARVNRPGGTAEERLAWVHTGACLPLGALVAAIPWLVPALVPEHKLPPLPPPAAMVPLGLLTAALVFAAGRQWVDGRALAAGGCLASVAYLLLFTWQVVFWKDSYERAPLAMESLSLRAQLAGYGPQARVYLVDVPGSEPEKLYYLDRDRIATVHGLLLDTLDAEGRPLPSPPRGDPPRVVICSKEVAEELGVSPGYGELVVVPLGYGVEGIQFKRFVK